MIKMMCIHTIYTVCTDEEQKKRIGLADQLFLNRTQMSGRGLAFDAKLRGINDNGGPCAVNTQQCMGFFIGKSL